MVSWRVRLLCQAAIGIRVQLLDAHRHAGLNFDLPTVVGAQDFGHAGEGHAFAKGTDLLARDVVEPQDDVLGRYDDGLAIGWRQYIVGGQHQGARLHLRLQRQRHMDCHLVAVEVGIERRADQRVKLNSFAFDQHRLERLDAQPMQSGCPIEHHRMLTDHLFQDVPHLGNFLLYQPLGGLDRRGQAHDL